MASDRDKLAVQNVITLSKESRNCWYFRSQSDTVFIFVHGIFSNSKDCWTSEGPSNSIFWPDLVIRDARLDCPSIFLAGYSTSLSSGDLRIKDAARDILDGLTLEDHLGNPGPLGKQNIILICHSTGGIVARYLLERFKDEFLEKTVGLVLVASPSLGSVYANKLSSLAKFYNQQLGLQLQWGGESLSDLDDRFKELVYEKKIPRLLGVEAYEHYFIFHRKVFPEFIERFIPNKRKLVSALSAGRYFGAPRLLSGTDHFSTVKPDGFEHVSHRLLVRFWEDFQTQFEIRSGLPETFSNEIAKQKPSIPLLFRDQLQPDPASVANVASQYFDGARDFEIRWPKETLELIHVAEELLLDAQRFYEKDSRFYAEAPESVMAFTEFARSSIKSARNIRESAVKRIVPMMEGMHEYCGDPIRSLTIENALKNYLKLANFEMQFGLAYALSHRRTRDYYSYSFWEAWLSMPNHLSRMARLFEIEGELGSAKAISLCEVRVYEIFWGPLAGILASVDEYVENRTALTITKLNVRWFLEYVIPQWNLVQARKGSNETIVYEPVGSIGNIWNSSWNEVEPRDFNPLWGDKKLADWEGY